MHLHVSNLIRLLQHTHNCSTTTNCYMHTHTPTLHSSGLGHIHDTCTSSQKTGTPDYMYRGCYSLIVAKHAQVTKFELQSCVWFRNEILQVFAAEHFSSGRASWTFGALFPPILFAKFLSIRIFRISTDALLSMRNMFWVELAYKRASIKLHQLSCILKTNLYNFKMGSLFRSEEMTLAQLFLQSEAAYACVRELGEIVSEADWCSPA